MSRPDSERLLDIQLACEAITSYVARIDADEDLVFDAIRARLIEVGEAVKDLNPALLSREPDISWAEIARMRDSLTHRYFDTNHAIVRSTAITDVPRLLAAVRRLRT